MNLILRAFGLALKGIFNPWVLWLSLRPFLIGAMIWFGLLWLIWTPLLDWMKTLLTTSNFAEWITNMMPSFGWDIVRAVVVPYFSVVVLMPLIVVSILVLVSFTTVTSVLRHVERQQQYQGLRQAKGGSFLGSLGVNIGSTCIFMVLVVITLPIWWIPPIFALIPPLLWGWLTMRLMSYDVLARHASHTERLELMEIYRWQLLAMGVIAGLLGAIPTFFWLSSIFVLVLFPFVSMFMMWIYSLVFIFASLWFTHYLLFALKNYRELKGESI
jgi:hypothetical protein